MGNYIKNKGILVGIFNEDELKKHIDKIEVEKAMKKYKLNCVNTEFVYENGEIVAMKIYVYELKDVRLPFCINEDE